MSSLTGNEKTEFINGSSLQTAFVAGSHNFGSLATSTNLRVVAFFSILSKNNTLSVVTSVTDSGGLTWHKAGSVSQLSINNPGGLSGAPLAQGIEIWYTDTFTSATITSPSTYVLTVNTDSSPTAGSNNVDSIAVHFGVQKSHDTTHPLDLNASWPASGVRNSGSTATITLSALTTNTTNTTIAVMYGAVGPGQRPGSGGSPIVAGVTTADYGQGDTFSLNQNYNIFGVGNYDRTAVMTSQSAVTHDATNNALFLAVAFTDDAQSVAVTGTWASTEAKDVFAASGGYTGVWASTEAKDTFTAYAVTSASGTWASTEAPDICGSASHARLGVENATVGGGSFNFSTNGSNRIICVIAAGTTVGLTPSKITSITGAGLTFHQQDVLEVGDDEDLDRMRTELWWAYAKNPVPNQGFAITWDNSNSTTIDTAVFAVKGLGGNFNNPFIDQNPYSFGSNYGAFHTPPLTQIAAATPIATGPLSSSGGVNTPVQFDPAQAVGVTLSATNRSVTSAGVVGMLGFNSVPLTDTAVKSEGRVYFECKFTHIAGTHFGFGLRMEGSNTVINQLITNGLGGVTIKGDGSIWAAGINTGRSLGVTPVDGDIIAVCVDFDNDYFWARDVTQAGYWLGSSFIKPEYSSDAYGGYGVPFRNNSFHGTPITNDAPPHNGTSGSVKLWAFPDETSTSAKMEFNFGQSAFVGVIPPGYTAGWGNVSPAVPPVHVTQHALVLGWGLSTTGDSSGIVEPPPGYSEVITIGQLGSQRHVRLGVYSRPISENILTTDGDYLKQASATKHWAMMYDTLVVGEPDPGSLESTEAKDRFLGIGYVGFSSGIIGFFTATEAKDTFAATGYQPNIGVWASAEATDIFSAYGSQPLTMVWHSTETKDVFAGTGIGRGEDGVWISTEAVDILTISGIVPIAGTFDTTETVDRFRAIGAGVIQAHRRRRGFIA